MNSRINEQFFEDLIDDIESLQENRPDKLDLFKHHVPFTKTTLKSCSDAQQAIRTVVHLMNLAKYEACITIANKWSHQAEYQADFLAALGICYLKVDRIQDAVHFLQEALRAFPFDWYSLQILTRIGGQVPELDVESLKRPKKDAGWLKNLVETYSVIYNLQYLLDNHEFRTCIEIIETLDIKDARILLLLKAKAHYSASDYSASANAFQRLRQVEPTKTKDMDLYSTALWFQKKQLEMNILAKELSEIDRFAPEYWVALGNVHSAQKDHSNAIKCFQRSTKVDKAYIYGHVLAGHEFIMNEDFDEALMSYREALRLDPLNYHAWYGIGEIFFRQDKFELCQVHWNKALKLNPKSFQLMCHMGNLMQKLGNLADSLRFYKKSLTINHQSSLSTYKISQILFQMNENEQALRILESIEPVELEPNVLLLKARIQKKLGQRGEALVNFTLAQELESKRGRQGHLMLEQFLDDVDLEIEY